MRRWIPGTLPTALACVVATLAQDRAAPKRYALLVGVNQYEHAEMNRPDPLRFAEADVTALAELLRAGTRWTC